MREVIGLALSEMLFRLSNQMGTIIRLTGRGWQQPYRAYYKLVDASQRARTWAQRSPRNSGQGEQSARRPIHGKRVPLGTFHGRIITPMMGRDAHLVSRRNGGNSFYDSGKQNVLRQGYANPDAAAKPYGEHTGQT